MSELVASTIGGRDDTVWAPFVTLLVAVEYLIDTASENIMARGYLNIEPLRDIAITEVCSVGPA